MKGARCQLLFLLVAMIPATASCLLVYLYFHCGPTAYNVFWNDELDYWHQILTFTRHGFSGGYYSIEELLAPAAFSHFGTHGPVFPVFYGMIGKVVGWTTFSGPLFHFVAVTLAAVIFLQSIKPDGRQLLLTAAGLLTFWPLLLYLPTTMQEPLHMSLALVLAGLFSRLLTSSPASKKTLLLTLVVVVFASLLRASWGLLFIPLLLTGKNGQSRTAIVKLLVAGVLCLAISLFAFTFLAAPYPDNFVNGLLSLGKSQPLAGWHFFLDHLGTNLRHYFSWQDGEPLETAVRYQLLLVLIPALWIRFLDPGKRRSRQESLIQCSNVLLILLLVIFLYDIDDWRAYRILSPHLLFSLALFIACRRWAAACILIAGGLFFCQNFATLYPVFHRGHFSGDNSAAAAFTAAYGGELRFRQDVPPWGNSLLIGMDDCQPFLAGLPAGIGMNCVLDWDRIRYPLKSAYVIIPPEVYRHLEGRVNLRLVTAGRFGGLFVNLDSPAASLTERQPNPATKKP